MLRINLLFISCFVSIICFSQEQIKGQIRMEGSNVGLVGVQIKVFGKAIKTQTDSTGGFQISASIGDTLLVEMFDFKPKKVTITNTDYLKIYLAFVVPTSPPNIERHSEFPGGLTKFQGYLSRNIKGLKKSKTHGRVYVRFMIDTTGLVIPRYTKTQKTIKSDINIYEMYGEEVIRVINNSPAWTPAIVRGGKKVRESFTLPIEY